MSDTTKPKYCPTKPKPLMTSTALACLPRAFAVQIYTCKKIELAHIRKNPASRSTRMNSMACYLSHLYTSIPLCSCPQLTGGATASDSNLLILSAWSRYLTYTGRSPLPKARIYQDMVFNISSLASVHVKLLRVQGAETIGDPALS
ncbi:hypothetical protein MPTK1_7g18620 [Marchantia polymorpha subsp. ruderalis]|uniref:Uncharacterized protein n=2 Tax=Marchantia polymorpha TaxID=3197 RepID=A0AAF6C159_MARPO|nr:hypothetical protein MARPO_0165s0022 [Marchantia polymorpha]BBN17993.1 hypothetical protein Mp_7g18620 [Marchantia polymorpha subsp. ruderalis]|eukprot:PTQ28395.1 hypothetical protein MARPO_0165s0022 [Marchantia polymorpha]